MKWNEVSEKTPSVDQLYIVQLDDGETEFGFWEGEQFANPKGEALPVKRWYGIGSAMQDHRHAQALRRAANGSWAYCVSVVSQNNFFRDNLQKVADAMVLFAVDNCDPECDRSELELLRSLYRNMRSALDWDVEG